MQSKILQSVKILILVFIASLGITYASAWSGPPGPPFDCPSGYVGCDGPIHVGPAEQTKTGPLNVNGAFWAGGLFTNGGGYFGEQVGIGTDTPAPGVHLDVNGWTTSNNYWVKEGGIVNFPSVAGEKIRLYNGYSIGIAPSTMTFSSAGAGFSFSQGANSIVSINTTGTRILGNVTTTGGGAGFIMHSRTGNTPDSEWHSSQPGITSLRSHRTGTNVLNINTNNNTVDVLGKTVTQNLQVSSGAAAGRVLTSDAAGNATWQPAAAGADPTMVRFPNRTADFVMGVYDQCFLQSFYEDEQADRDWCLLSVDGGNSWSANIRNATCDIVCINW